MANDVQQRQLSREEQEEKRRQQLDREWRDAAERVIKYTVIRLQDTVKAGQPGAYLLTEEQLEQAMRRALRKTPDLAWCDPASVVKAVQEAIGLQLDFTGINGSGYLLPFKHECTFVAGYKGMIDLAVSAGACKSINANVVFEADAFEYEEGSDGHIRHRPSLQQDRGAPICVYAIAALPNGGEVRQVLPWWQVMEYKTRSAGARSSSSPWNSKHERDVHWMGMKTAIRQLFKLLPSNVARNAALLRMLNRDDQIDAEEGEIIDIPRAPSNPSRTAALADDLAGMAQPPQLPESTGGEPADLTPAPEQARVPASRPQSQAAMEWGKK